MKPFAGLALVPSFIALAAKYGVSLDSLYQQAGLDMREISRAKVMLSVGDVDRILQAYRDINGEDGFFLELGQNIRFDSLGAVGSMVATSSTPREAFDDFTQFKDIIHPYVNFQLMDHGNGRTAVVFEPEDGESLAAKPYYAELFFSAFISLSKLLLSGGPDHAEVHFTHPRPANAEQYEKIFGPHVHFGAKRNELIFDSQWLDIELASASPEFRKLSSQKVLSELSKLPSEDNLVARVVRCIEDHIGHSVLSMQKVADKLNTTPRTLQRRLKDENVTYAALRDQVLYKHARRYLIETDLDMATISANLSFSEPATFNNAFKRWSGMSPGAYRKANRKSI
ncbi:MAG: AraC family transcriptional regulator [Pseudomonadota bacterium]